MEKGAHPQGNQRSLSHQHGLQPRDFRPGLWFRETAYGNLHRQQRDGGIMGDASSEMSKVIAKAVAFFIYIGRKARKVTYSFQSCFLCGIIGTIEK